MKTTKTILLVIFSFLTIVLGCSDDKSLKVDSTPEFKSLVQEISSLPGQTFTFTGIVSDPAGIKSINIKYESWFLDKTIVLETVPASYDLSYKFKVPTTAEVNSVHTIPITIVNSGGIATTQNVKVTLNQDIVKPVIKITKPLDGATAIIGAGKEVELNVTVTDAKLAEFKIESSVLNETIPLTESTYTYTKSLDIEKIGKYPFKITVKDISGNSTTSTVTVNVFDGLLFDKMFITEVKDESMLVADVFGVPASTLGSTITAEKGSVFIAKYYASKPNTEVRFLPQKDSFAPYTFGADPTAVGKLLLGANANVNPIVLPQVGYYMIKMDLRDRTYTVESYTPSDTPYPQIYILGTGVFIDNTSTCISNLDGSLLCWHYSSGKPLKKDPNNVYLWSIDVKIDDEPNNGGANGFILNANPNNWGPFWRLNADDPSIAVLNGGKDFVFPPESLGKDYTITFDTHLNKVAIIKR
jgi:hypothetical protein